MKNRLIFIFFLITYSYGSLAQADPDFLQFKQDGDYCFQKGKYECARQNYANALRIKEKDSYCVNQMLAIEQKETEKKKYIENRKKEAIKNANKFHKGTIKDIKDSESGFYTYVGDIKNKKPNGFGTAYYDSGEEQEGRWINGKQTGKFKGKKYDEGTFDCNYVDGLMEGYTTFTTKEGYGTFFYKKGKMTGMQKLTTSEGYRVEVMAENGKFEGQSTNYTQNGEKIVGYSKGGEMIGEVTAYIKEGRMVGIMKNGNINGKVKVYFTIGAYFEGIFKNNLPNGQGIFYTLDGDKFEGVFENGYNVVGKAKVTFKNKDFYEGEILHAASTGNGKMTFANGEYYEGNWLNNLFDGEGYYVARPNSFITNCPKCVEYEGQFLNGLKHGKGKCYDSKDDLIYEGKFVNNIPVDKYPSKRKK
jgi:hypothetical protein